MKLLFYFVKLCIVFVLELKLRIQVINKKPGLLKCKAVQEQIRHWKHRLITSGKLRTQLKDMWDVTKKGEDRKWEEIDIKSENTQALSK